MSSWTSYSSIYAMGHRAIKDLLNHDVLVEEKVDGSQFSFGLVEASEADIVYDTFLKDGVLTPYALKIRSKGCVMHIDAPEKMFEKAGETVRNLAVSKGLTPGWTYRGEFLGRPKHNSLAYDRVPGRVCTDCLGGVADTGTITEFCRTCNGEGRIKNYIILFDVNTGNQEYLSYEDKLAEGARLGLEVVPLLFSGRVDSVETFRSFLDRVSVLGGQLIEGVVVKPVAYDLFGTDKKVLMGKFVSEHFKEVHRKAWAENNPTTKDIIGLISSMYCTPARWAKAVQHLREAGTLVEDVQDIGPLMREVPEDVKKECEEDIKTELFKFAWPHIRRGLTVGLPAWYKEQLLKKSFENEGPEQAPKESVIGSSDSVSDPNNASINNGVVEQ